MSQESPASSRRPFLRVVEPEARAEAPSAERRPRVAARWRKTLVLLDAREVWAFEADARSTFAHCALGKLAIDVSLADVEASRLGGVFLRVHRSWLVNVDAVRALDPREGRPELVLGAALSQKRGRAGEELRAPVSRDRLRAVKGRLLADTIGLHTRDTTPTARED